MTLARRKFLGQAAAAATLPFWPKSLLASAPAPPLVRYNVLSSQGQAMVQKYAKAVKIMKTKPASDPCSWDFQWYTHAIPVSKAQALTNVFGSTNPPARALANAAWWTCQPHQSGQNSDNFLPWHRMFVYYFEEIIRFTLQDASFTLPYWNYSPGLNASTTSGVMPAAFRSSSNPALASLYVANRNSLANGGQSIDKGNAGLLSATPSLSCTTYSSHAPVQGFCDTLDFGLHGNVHGLIGTNSNMGSVPTAGQDPVFWMHHCNIDRLWASWNKAGYTNPTDAAWLAQKFTFAGPDATTKVIAFSEVMATSQLNYVYDSYEAVPHKVQATPKLFNGLALKQPVASATTIASATRVSLATASTRASLKAPAAAANNKMFNLALGAPEPGVGRYYLVIKGLEIKTQPGVVYELYLDLPDGASAAAKQSHAVGSLNFFNAMPGMAMDADRFISYDITNIVKTVGVAAIKGQIDLTVAPLGQPAGDAAPVIGSVSIVQL